MTNAEPTDHRTPGQLISELLEARGWSQRVLAIVLGMDVAVVNRIVSGKATVDAERALALGEVLGVPAERFLSLQSAYDLARARIVTRPDPDREMRAYLFGGLPIAEMIKRGWLMADDVRQVPQVETALAKFFGVRSSSEIEILPHAAKKTNVTGDVTPTQLAWIYRVKQIASEMIVGRYSPSAVREALPRLKALLSAPEEARHVPRILDQAGIRYVIVESLTSAKIDGVCLWLNDTSPVIGMSLRFDRMDNFWFVLRHEIEHVLRLDGQISIMLDADLEGQGANGTAVVPDEERVANEAAAEFCVPQQSMDRFVARKAPVFAERDILGFARTLQVHPAFVAGQLQRKTGRYDRFRSHQSKIRAFVTPSAQSDGWGNIAPVDE